MAYSQGDIVTVPFPFTDQKSSKLRPALVISGKSLNATDDILLVMITKNNRKDDFSVPIGSKDLSTPLNFVSELRCHKLLVADQSLIKKTVSKASAALVEKVKDKIIQILQP